MSQQLSLRMRPRDDATFASFLPAKNYTPLAVISRLSYGIGEFSTYIWGNTGTGKTHLLQAACSQAIDQGFSTMLLSLKDNADIKPQALSGLDNIDLLCIDDFDVIENFSNIEHWQENLLNLFSLAKSKDHKILVSSKLKPNFEFYEWNEHYLLNDLDQDEKVNALKLRSQMRGILLQDLAAKFLVKHCSAKGTNELFGALEKIDELSFSNKKRITVPFIKEFLALKRKDL